jgi:hypothetical protein
MVANHGGQLETIQIGHADVHQHHGDIRFEEMLKGFPARTCLKQVFVKAM